MILRVSHVIFFHPYYLMITLAKILFLLFFKLRTQIFWGKFVVSYNVTSPFINMPLQETIDITINVIFNHNRNINITTKELFLFATSQTHFLFNGKFYSEIDEVGMFSPFASALAISSVLAILSWVFTNLNSKMSIISTNPNYI